MREIIEKIQRPPYPPHDFGRIVAAVHPSGRAFGCASSLIVDVRNVTDGAVLQAVPLEESASCVSFSPDGSALLLGLDCGRVQSLDARTLAIRAKTPAMYDAV